MTKTSETRISRRKLTVMGSAALVGLGLVPAAAQVGTPEAVSPAATPAATPVAATATITNLISAQIDELPPAPFTVRLLRINLQPGAITPMHSHHGPEIDRVESGEVTIRSAGEAPVTRANGAKETSTGDDVLLKVGDSVHFPATVGMYFENTGNEPAVMLSAVIIPVGPDYVNERIIWVDGEPNLDGVSYQKLGDGLVQEMATQPATWTIDQVELPAHVAMPALAGVSMITPTKGNLSFKIDAGQVQVTRAASNMLQPNAVLGTSFSLGDGDAAFFPNGVEATERTEEQGALSFIAMDIVPRDGSTAAAARLTFSAGDGTLAGVEPSDIIGKTVTTNTDGVNMRAEASVDAEIIDQLDEGIELEVMDGPVDADDYTWYMVKVKEDGGNEGWIVSEFLDGISGAKASSASPTGDGTSAGSSTFKTGDTVVTIEEGVRLRPEPNTGSEAIDALSLDTVLTVTGDSVTRDGYTWLPVETEDGTEGYVVTDFVKLKP